MVDGVKKRGFWGLELLPEPGCELWAIDYDPEHPGRHVRFETFRGLSDAELDEFVELLIGSR